MNRRFLVAALGLIVGWAAADDCSPVRLDQNGGSMVGVSATNQKSKGICYAVATQGLFDAYRTQRAKAGKKVESSSPHHAAISYSLEIFERGVPFGVDGGYVTQLLERMIENGGCNREGFDKTHDLNDLESQLDVLLSMKGKYDVGRATKNVPALRPPKYNGLDWFHSRMRGTYDQFNGKLFQAGRSLEEAEACSFEEIQKTFRASPPSTLSEIRKKFEDDSLKEFLETMDRVTCPDGMRTSAVPAPKIKEEAFYPPEVLDLRKKIIETYKKADISEEDLDRLHGEFAKKLEALAADPAFLRARSAKARSLVDEALKKTGLPIAVSYCSGAVSRPRSVVDRLFSGEKGCGSHASLIIGRKWNPRYGKCFLLIRNSWGEDARNYDRSRVIPEGPDYWVPEDTLYASTMLEMTTLLPP